MTRNRSSEILKFSRENVEIFGGPRTKTKFVKWSEKVENRCSNTSAVNISRLWQCLSSQGMGSTVTLCSKNSIPSLKIQLKAYYFTLVIKDLEIFTWWLTKRNEIN